MKLEKLLLIMFLALCIGMVSCDDDDDSTSAFDTTLSEVVNNYATIVHANYQDALTDAMDIKTKVDALIASPSQSTLDAAKDSWLNAQESYGQTEVFRFYGGPIDDEDGPEGQLNAWPLDESLIDYVTGSVNGGDSNDGSNIINSPDQFPEITKQSIANLNEVGAETNISTGFHAVEFLLWGQDESTGAGGGTRPFTDYVTDGNGTNENQDRRGQYLSEAAQLIVDDLEGLVAEWAEGGAYRTLFTSDTELENSLEKILNGMGKLSKGELAGERIFVAYDLRSKEDEHSCFSDNTHRDIVTNALGIQNVFLGTYKRIDGSSIAGKGIYDLLLLDNSELAERLKTTMEASMTASEAIQSPFDQEILNEDGRTRVQACFTSLRTQGDELAEAASKFGFTFDPEDI